MFQRLASLTPSGQARVPGAWAVYDFANTIFSFAVVSGAIGLWLTDTHQFGERDGNFLLSVGIVVSVGVNALVSPILGALSDRGGQRLPFLLAFTVLCVGATAFIAESLAGYNESRAGFRDFRPLAILVSDPDTGELIGGLYGRTSLGVMFIDRFFLPEMLRGHRLGSRLLAMAEAEGRRRGCTLAGLFTLQFQAPGFYRKQGWEIAAKLDVPPPGATRYLMTKKLV